MSCSCLSKSSLSSATIRCAVCACSNLQRNTTSVHVQKKKKLRDVTSHMFAQTTHVALPNQSSHVGWGPGRSQPCQVSIIKISQGVLALWGVKICHFRMQNQSRGFGSLRCRNLPFSYAWRYGLIIIIITRWLLRRHNMESNSRAPALVVIRVRNSMS